MTDPVLTDVEREQIAIELEADLRRLAGITTTITTAADVTDKCLTAAEGVFEGWFDGGEPIDWYDFADRLEAHGWTIVDMYCPAIAKIQRHIRKFRNL